MASPITTKLLLHSFSFRRCQLDLSSVLKANLVITHAAGLFATPLNRRCDERQHKRVHTANGVREPIWLMGVLRWEFEQRERLVGSVFLHLGGQCLRWIASCLPSKAPRRHSKSYERTQSIHTLHRRAPQHQHKHSCRVFVDVLPEETAVRTDQWDVQASSLASAPRPPPDLLHSRRTSL